MAQTQSPNLDGLPKGFVTAMRTLFDIMDDESSGFVRFADIEERWRDDGKQGLPKGVLESLKKVTPPNGLLSFERFCTGLKICLLQIQSDAETNKSSEIQPNRPPSAPVLIVDAQNKLSWTSPNTATIRPNNVISQQRTLSMPQLPAGRKEAGILPEASDNRTAPEPKITKAYGPPKPPRTGAGLEARAMAMNFERNIDKSEIRTALQNWQMGLMMGDEKLAEKRQIASMNYQVDPRNLVRPARALGDGKAIDTQNNQISVQQKKSLARRREPRRHTLQNDETDETN